MNMIAKSLRSFRGLVALLALVVIQCFLVSAAHAASKYVRAGAIGNGSGADWANAYPTLPSTLVRGDTYYIADGNYGGYTFNTPTSGQQYIYIKKASGGDHGTDVGWNSSFGDGQVVFTGNGSS
jgi:hypothetical protein